MEGEDAIITLRMRVCPEAVAWVLSLGERAIVLEPEGLRRQVAAAAKSIAEHYG
jgi:hypothetical protein